MMRILFVDDESAVLDGLRDRLRKHRREWEMVFALGGEAALTECARAPFDVVVSDMRMPGMDGATFLQQVKDEYPSTIRIVLSGHAERESIMRSLPVAHQYLSKPCDAETLRGVIARACAQLALMKDESLRGLVGRVGSLPSVATVYTELTEVLARETSSVDDFVRVVERDPAMCLKLLQVVNSAFFGLPRRIKVMREAIAYLGAERLRSLTLVSQIFAVAGSNSADQALLSAIQEHSSHVACLARTLSPQNAEDAFMGGMLHDVGEIVLLLADRERYTGIRNDARERGVTVLDIERERLGLTHAEVGAYVLGTWGVPLGIAAAVLGHHDPAHYGSSLLDAPTAVHIADSLAAELEPNRESPAPPLDEAYIGRLGLLGELPAWRGLAKRLREEGAR
jgi:HD-like signal output (HDOD) protein/ActR/RegA family two-component response regulator